MTRARGLSVEVPSEDDETSKDISPIADSETTQVKKPRKNSEKNGRRRKKKAAFMETTFEDVYDLDEARLGKGAFSNVVSCHNKASGKEYAVKLIDSSGGNRASAYRELEVLQRCKGHPAIVQLIDFFETEGKLYLVFEKMEGGSLLEHVEARKSEFTELEASRIIRDVASGLAYLHSSGIAHRDLKPANILCAGKESASPAKLCDFNLAGGSFEGHKVSTPHMKTPAGSLEFLAPEVIATIDDPGHFYDKQCDIWSLGTILYILLAGYPPFYEACNTEGCEWALGESCDYCAATLLRNVTQGYLTFPQESWSHISQQARSLVAAMLAHNPDDRPTADQLLRHPWVNNAAPDTPLVTPQLLELSLVRSFTRKANSFSRLIDDDEDEEGESPAHGVESLRLSHGSSTSSLRELDVADRPGESLATLGGGASTGASLLFPGQQPSSKA